MEYYDRFDIRMRCTVIEVEMRSRCYLRIGHVTQALIMIQDKG